jgi:hypothetical protein
MRSPKRHVQSQRHRPGRRRRTVGSPMVLAGLVVAVGLVAFSAPLALAHGGDPDKVHACVVTGSGAIRIVAAGETCNRGETPLDWSQQDTNTTYAAGFGLSLNANNVFSVTGAPWSGLTGIPAGFADGVDDVSTTASDLECAGCVGPGDIARLGVHKDNIYPGAIDTSQLADTAITAAKIANGAVTTDKIAAGAVTNDNVANNAITTYAIANGAVTTDKIAAGAVTNDNVANNAITTYAIANGAVTTDKLGDGAIIGDSATLTATPGFQLSPGSKIMSGTVTGGVDAEGRATGNLAQGTVVGSRLDAGGSFVTGGNLAPDTVTFADIGSAAVGTDELQDGAATSKKTTANVASRTDGSPVGVDTSSISILEVPLTVPGGGPQAHAVVFTGQVQFTCTPNADTDATSTCAGKQVSVGVVDTGVSPPQRKGLEYSGTFAAEGVITVPVSVFASEAPGAHTYSLRVRVAAPAGVTVTATNRVLTAVDHGRIP